jgi:hypothetical protein
MTDEAAGPSTMSSPAMRRRYVRVLIIWVVVLVSLYIFEKVFS